MSADQVCLVTAFGRGETLVRALEQARFRVTTLDFTDAFGAEFTRGLGPFPVALTEYLPAQAELLGEMRPLPRGLAFWLNDGPIELAGEMAAHFSDVVPAVKNLRANQAVADFGDDWMRRFVDQWTSPYHAEAWENATPARFPYDQPLGLAPAHREVRLTTPKTAVRCKAIEDIQINNQRLLEIAVDAGRITAYRADQFVWCLSSRETEMLNSQLATKVFTRGIIRPEWAWITFKVTCQTGPWLEGIPEHVIAIGDVYLPWTYANLVILRKMPGDVFEAWVKVPAARVDEDAERLRWAADVGALLNRRLNLARWQVDGDRYGICPHAPVFEASRRDVSAPPWRNWDWIAPETVARLDVGARLEREAQAFRRIDQWRRDTEKKQGGPRDHALHAP